MKRITSLIALAAALFATVAIALDFPPLTERVVDEANILSPATRTQLTEKLAQHERETSNQVVVVTLASLRGLPIEDYGYQLGRAWGIGQKERNNGVLLIVAPNEKKVRIEVGYGLEGTLTDVKSHTIIQEVILPSFREGNLEKGVVDGTDAILGTLAGTYQPMPSSEAKVSKMDAALALGLVCLVVGQTIFYNVRPRALGGVLLGGATGALIWWLLDLTLLAFVIGAAVTVLHIITGVLGGGRNFGPGGGYWGGGGGGGFGRSGGGGFSGGGGSFGGGGASGSW